MVTGKTFKGISLSWANSVLSMTMAQNVHHQLPSCPSTAAPRGMLEKITRQERTDEDWRGIAPVMSTVSICADHRLWTLCTNGEATRL